MLLKMKVLNRGNLLLARAISGRATTEGTKSFVARSKLRLYHRLELSQLYVNPVIHGPPVPGTLSQEDSDLCFAQALLRNKCNALFVYSHSSLGPWATGVLGQALQAGKLNRSDIVAIAGLGKVSQAALQIRARLDEARALTGLEFIDMAIVEFDDASLERNPNCIDAAIEVLEKVCREGHLSSYGLQVDVAPYRHHTPAPRISNSLAMIPPLLEDAFGADPSSAPHADLVMYSISPTTALPASYPMLDPDEIDLDELAELENKASADDVVGGDRDARQEDQVMRGDYASNTRSDGERRITRVARDPLLCVRGNGNGDGTGEGDSDGGLSVEELAKLDQEANAAEASTNNTISDAIDSRDTATETPTDEPLIPRSDGIPLVSGLLPPELEKLLGAALDELCPDLSDTPLLQHKALRAVMSVGVDAVVVDAELSACLGELDLRPEQLLPSAATDDVFGVFQLPPDLIPRTSDREK